jgi:hypothetical protein
LEINLYCLKYLLAISNKLSSRAFFMVKFNLFLKVIGSLDKYFIALSIMDIEASSFKLSIFVI